MNVKEEFTSTTTNEQPQSTDISKNPLGSLEEGSLPSTISSTSDATSESSYSTVMYEDVSPQKSSATTDGQGSGDNSCNTCSLSIVYMKALNFVIQKI
jgi:hypothetical protein